MYKCKTEFIDDNDKIHKFGDIISKEEYEDLTSQQQRKYEFVGTLAVVE